MKQKPNYAPDESGFTELFTRATGHGPFPYQWRLAAADPFPSLLNVPTGAGKTAAAILGWLWRRRFSADAVRATTPRRLVYCLPMRVLVEQTAENAAQWLRNLDLLADKPGDDDPAVDGRARIAVSLLMGGEAADDWDAYPERDAILIGTQDMLLSRALNRGYGMSRYRWPMQFALLNNDCLWVMDEVQLMGAGLPTTTQLQSFREQMETYGPTRSLWMSATVKTDALRTVDFQDRVDAMVENGVGLGAEDRKHLLLSQRLNAPKALFQAQTVLTKENEQKGYARDLAREVAGLHHPGSLSLVVLNRVKRAQDVFQALQALSDESPRAPELLLIHSRFRPHERQALQARLRQVDSEPPPGGCIVVATQAVEAGVDISARLLFSELAPWTSLVQRFGRCNRRGEWEGDTSARVFWVDMASDKDLVHRALPYEVSDLDWARETLAGLHAVGSREIAGVEDPSPAPLTHILRRRDLLDLFDTTPDLAGNDLDVSRYIRDAEDNDLQVYWREWEGDDPPNDLPPPRREELCSVSLPSIRKFLKNAVAYRWEGLDGRWEARFPLWPGLTLLLHSRVGGYDSDLGWIGVGAPPIPPVPRPPAGAVSGGPDATDEDTETFSGRFVHISEHTDQVVMEMHRLAVALRVLMDVPGTTQAPWDDLLCAARWHDAGKAHPAFQTALLEGKSDDDPHHLGGPWAKSDDRRRRLRYGISKNGRFQERRHFRHELASALLNLQNGGEDLVAYLVAAHHGKVRMSIRSLPDENVPTDGRRFARGVWEGDVVSPFNLKEDLPLPETRLRLGLMELGEGEDGPSWLERTLSLRDRYGPFRLAWLETMLRVADWRGTQKGARTDREEVEQRA